MRSKCSANISISSLIAALTFPLDAPPLPAPINGKATLRAPSWRASSNALRVDARTEASLDRQSMLIPAT